VLEPPLPSVSVVVCTYNDEKVIGECLKALMGQSFPGIELIVVDDGSTDRTPRILEEFEGIRHFRQPNGGPSAARNLGILEATGDFVCFIDSDCRAASDCVERLIAGHRSAGSECCCGVGGRQEGHPEDPSFARRVDRFLSSVGFIGDYVKPYSGPRIVGHNAACNVSYRRQPLVEVGGFRVGMFPGEDVDLDRRLGNGGWTVRFVPDAVVFHHRPVRFRGFLRMLWNYGRASADNVAIHGFFRQVQLIPLIAVALAIALGGSAWAGATVFVAAVGALAVTVLIVAVWYGRKATVRSVPLAVTALCVFSVAFFVHLAATLVRPPFDLRSEISPLEPTVEAVDEVR